ncbi:MAG TPA: XdhC/CoxI family protein [Anaeromyxobacter sp.]|nr:XdhC/CoxI family protein [Anaeromyxobacter sp.]
MEDVYEALVRLRAAGHRSALATIVNVSGSIPSFKSAKMLVGEEGTLVGTIGGGCVEAEVVQAAREVIAEERPRTLRFDLNQNPRYDTGLLCGGSLEIFVEPVLPAAVVYVFGAGHVGFQVYTVARIAGFEVVVVDDRGAFASRERFPHAREVLCGEMDPLLARLSPVPGSFLIIATRGHRDDMRVLRWALKTQAGYVGMLGSKRKVLAIFRELREEGADPAALERVHAPVGLSIGATTPEEIAVSVVAELIACRRRAASAQPLMLTATRPRSKPTAAPAAPEAEASPEVAGALPRSAGS